MKALNLSLFKLGTEDYDTRFEMDLENIEAFETNLELFQKGPLYVRDLDMIFHRIGTTFIPTLNISKV